MQRRKRRAKDVGGSARETEPFSFEPPRAPASSEVDAGVVTFVACRQEGRAATEARADEEATLPNTSPTHGLDKRAHSDHDSADVTPYRTQDSTEEIDPAIELVLPRPTLWNAHAVSFAMLTVVAVAVAILEGSFLFVWLPVATGLTWFRWGFLRETRLTVSPEGSHWHLRLEQRAVMRAPVVTEFTMLRSARVELMSRSLGLGRTMGSLELWVDGKAAHLLEFVDDKEREQLVSEAARAFNDALDARVRRPVPKPFVSKFILALKTDAAAVVRGLLEEGLAPNTTHEEDTLAEHAAIRGAPRCLAAVLEARCKPTPRALALAAWAAPKSDRARFAKHLECAEMLLVAGVSPDAPAVDAGTAREAFAAAGPEFLALLGVG